MNTLTLADFRPEHLPGALRLVAEARWPHRAEDLAFFLRLSRGIVALDGGQVVGTTLLTRFGPVAVMSMIVVDARLRGRGIGRRMMEQVMAGAAVAELRLVATEEGRPLYEKLGFAVTGEIVQHQGIAAPQAADLPSGDVSWVDGAEREALLPAIAALDAEAAQADRASLVSALAGAGRIAVLRRRGAPAGYLALRAFGRGDVAGPVVAPDRPGAEALLSAALAACEGRFLRIDTPAETGLGDWLAARGLAHAGGGLAMRRGAPALPAPQTHHLFALAAQALG
ncbi:GNAT family N-acetyltransferase [Paralimibaculum aggregatum]|nr:GNAT family N-acetyltransferase [Limibaculum sp. NKW23]